MSTSNTPSAIFANVFVKRKTKLFFRKIFARLRKFCERFREID